MAATGKDSSSGKGEKDLGLWWHVRILYSCLLLLTAGTGCALWLSFSEIYTLRRDFEHEILHGDRAVEFANLYNEEEPRGGSTMGGGAGGSGTGGTSRRGGQYTQSHPEEEEEEDEEGVESVMRDGGTQEEDQLIRVKRGAGGGGGRGGRRRKFRDGPAAYPSPKLWEKEGSGGPNDWVWLTSYSRIPVGPHTCSPTLPPMRVPTCWFLVWLIYI